MAKLGIDFGTTRTVVAVCDRGNYPVLGFLGPDGNSTDWYPSVVAEREGELTFGLDAAAVAHDPSYAVVRSFKRLLGAPDVSPETRIQIGALEMTVLDLVTRFLVALKRDIVERSNLPSAFTDDTPMRCVVATPANAHSTQRFITLESFRRAGFEVVAMLNEPSAAGVEYAHRYRNTITSKREHILVYDLGGGTFDASLVRMRGLAHDVIGSSGLSRLGGDDFDEALLDLVLEAKALDKAALEPRSLDTLRDQCRDAKERLNPSSKRIAIDLAAGLPGGLSEPVVIVAERFYERCMPLVDETLAMMKRVLDGRDGEALIYNDHTAPFAAVPISDAEIAGIYVVGGASTLPLIARMLKDSYGRRVHRSAYPSASTAIGLAIALDDQGFVLTERFSHHFGVFREARDGTEVAFDPIFNEVTEQPSLSGTSVTSVRTYRAAHNVGHFRYIECGWLDGHGAPSGDITPFAEVLFPFDPTLRRPEVDLRDVPVRRTGSAGPLVEERYSVNAGGIVELTIVDLETGFERRHRLGSPDPR